MKDASYTLSLEGITSKEDALSAIRKFADEHLDNKWIAGCDFNFDEWEEQPTKEMLDEAVPTVPPISASWDMHTAG